MNNSQIQTPSNKSPNKSALKVSMNGKPIQTSKNKKLHFIFNDQVLRNRCRSPREKKSKGVDDLLEMNLIQTEKIIEEEAIDKVELSPDLIHIKKEQKALLKIHKSSSDVHHSSSEESP